MNGRLFSLLLLGLIVLMVWRHFVRPNRAAIRHTARTSAIVLLVAATLGLGWHFWSH
ncbi:protein MIGRI [Chitinibacter tainanensis]|uniref:protein MIGRI n=1 Tax=Chitinibacter tainanensis TaxID=230667 RepID=UPI0003F5D56A|nr:hypothetical protein [Chitinibacter tainanensis]